MDNYDIIVDDGKILLKEYTITKSMSLNDFAKQLVQVDKVVETPMLPENCVKFKSNGTNSEYFIYFPMGTYKVRHLGKEYLVTYPHQIMYFRFGQLTNNRDLITRLFWNYDKVFDINSKSFHQAPLHNLYEDGRFCMGRVDNDPTQHGYVNKWVKAFFENEFNNDLNGGKLTIPVVSKSQEEAYDSTDEDTMVKLSLLWKDSPLVESKYKLSYVLKDIIPRLGVSQ